MFFYKGGNISVKLCSHDPQVENVLDSPQEINVIDCCAKLTANTPLITDKDIVLSKRVSNDGVAPIVRV